MPEDQKKRWYDYLLDSIDFLEPFFELGGWLLKLGVNASQFLLEFLLGLLQ